MLFPLLVRSTLRCFVQAQYFLNWNFWITEIEFVLGWNICCWKATSNLLRQKISWAEEDQLEERQFKFYFSKHGLKKLLSPYNFSTIRHPLQNVLQSCKDTQNQNTFPSRGLRQHTSHTKLKSVHSSRCWWCERLHKETFLFNLFLVLRLLLSSCSLHTQKHTFKYSL